MPVSAPRPRPALLAAAVLAVAGAAAGCGDTTAPLPPGAARFAPPPAYARWWPLVEACSGRTGDLARWAWYRAPEGALRAAGYGNAAAYTDVAARRVVLNAGLEQEGGVVRHEMLHALLGRESDAGSVAAAHPPSYFQGRCAGVVDCGYVGCGDAGPAPVPAPADAPALPLAGLDVAVEVTPARVSRTGADRVLTVVVRATNPMPQPGWVALEPTPGATAPAAHWTGFRIVPAGQPLPVTDLRRADFTGIVSVRGDGRVPFGAGETQWRVYDRVAAAFPPGEYRVVGIVNTRQVSAPLTVTP